MAQSRFRFARTVGGALAASLLLLASATLPGRAECPPGESFGPPTSIPVLGKPNRVILEDFDVDGALDMACTLFDNLDGTFNNRIAILLGNGAGGFGEPTYYTVGSRPASLCAADLDGDGQLDLAVANWNANTVSVLRGLGDGTFVPHSTITCGVRPYELLAARLNDDAFLDLVVASDGQATIHVLKGLGSGAFAAPVSYPLPEHGLGLAAGDLDGDSDVDIVATANQSGCVVFLGNGDGTLGAGTSIPTGPLAYSVTLGDVDADGDADLAVGNSSYGGVAILKGNGTGGFGAPTFYGGGSTNIGVVVIADLDHDGVQDFAAASASDNSLKLYKGETSGGAPTGTFSLRESIPAGTFPVGLATGDCDADLLPDLVVAGYGSANLLTLMSTCPAPPPPPERPHLVSVRDVRPDEGGHVFLRWTRSSLDAAGVAGISAYRIWRRLPPEIAASAADRAARDAAAAPANRRVIARASGPNASAVDFWEWLGEIPAQQLEGYGYTAPTIQDSSAAGNPYTAFFVTALTNNPTVFYESNVDSGYSVDNLPPPRPRRFEGAYSAGGIVLNWSGSVAPDVAAYRLYRGTSDAFVPAPSNLLASMSDSGYVDAGTTGGYYKLSAVDAHGNEGDHAALAVADVTGVPGGSGAVLWLAPPGPNPVRLGARLRFALPRDGTARLALHDLQGRLVRELSRGPLPAGEHSIQWDGRDRAERLVRSGLYVLSLEADGRVLRTRLVVAR